MSQPPFFVTTPIYYVNALPHLGHAYTTILADTLARFKRFTGHEVFFLTGTDEHGDKIAQAAAAAGEPPENYVYRISMAFRDVWMWLGLTYDDFIRTTEERHVRVVQQVLMALYTQSQAQPKGQEDLYFGEYGGHYCYGCERFYAEREMVGGQCPDHQTPLTFIKEQNYFFRMSKYQDWLVRHLEEHPDTIRPERYRNEVRRFLDEPLEDLCISRPVSRLQWGIPLPFDPHYVTYVWFDALINYVTALGYPDDPRFTRFWPAANHLIAKDILKPHGVYWPTMLKAMGLPPYRHLNVHGYWKIEEGKMSKSRGTVVRPLELTAKYGQDAFRYFLLREMVFGLDASFSEEALVSRLNANLANDLGNLLSRTIAMLDKYLAGQVPDVPVPATDLDSTLHRLATETPGMIDRAMEALQFHRALEAIWELINGLNRYIDSAKPWELAKRDRQALLRVLGHAWEGLRIVGLLLAPFLPETARAMWTQLGIAEDPREGRIIQATWGGDPRASRVARGAPLFPRVDAPTGLAGSAETEPPVVSIEEFGRMDLRVGQVLSAGPIPGSKKLLTLRVDVGGRVQQVVAGIQGHYAPEALIGRKVVVVANLKPALLMGVESQGMVLAAEDPSGRIILLTPEADVPPGAQVK